MKYTFLLCDDVISIQKHILTSAPISNIGKLESALKRVEQYFYYENINDIVELAAIYIISIAKAHAFPDGNKRTAVLSASFFLDYNGYILEESSLLPDLIEQAASGEILTKELTVKLKPFVKVDQ